MLAEVENSSVGDEEDKDDESNDDDGADEKDSVNSATFWIAWI